MENRKRISPESDAQFWCENNLDKDKYIKGEFLLEYVGERIEPKAAGEKERQYSAT
ncbi:uncharacterized protein LOC143050736 [Mytilus galloprovincialis]|uniref:uncharacterized protein LOC143050736 n=1 Tax=Mytilus galloprovincialis TaxID=29158 RepID=UPI003F7C19BC